MTGRGWCSVLGQLFTDLRWRPLDGAAVCVSPSMSEPAYSSPSASLALAAGLSPLPAPLEPGGGGEQKAAARARGMATPEPPRAPESAPAPELAPAPEPESAAGEPEGGRPGRAPCAGGAAPAISGAPADVVAVLGVAALARVEAVRVEQFADGGAHGRGSAGGVVPAVAPDPAGLQLGAAVAGPGVVSSVVEPLSMLSALSM